MGVPIFGPLMVKLVGTRNQRLVKRYLRLVDQINEREPELRRLTDAELRAKTDEFRRRAADGAKAFDLVPEVFAVAREAMDRAVGIRNIFNPAESFDPSLLPAEARALYEQVKTEIAAASPRPPEGDFLGCDAEVQPWQFVDIPPALYEAVREIYPESRPPFRARPFDVQLIGGMVLSEGRIAEMKTGEGKTIVAPLACYLACVQGMQVHVVTVNDYLVQRDRDWTFPFFRALGLRVGAIHPFHMQPPDRKREAYQCEVVYGTTSEFGFDYLRDNMKLRTEEQVQKRHDFAIVDEVDSILIDEARTPLIISGPAHAHKPRYDLADRIARHLVAKQKDWDAADEKVQSCKVEISGLEGDIRNARDKSKIPALKEQLEAARERLPRLESERDRFTQYYEVELDKKRATLTHDGIAEAQRAAGVGSFYVGDNIDLPHLLEQAIRAHVVYQRDRDYVVAPDEDGQLGVVIVDQNTGRKMVGRQWSDGLHQAVEAKEGVRIKDETQTMATITIQNFFKTYKRLAGMTGTADTEATEFHEIYRLDVVSIPTNVPVVRVDRNDLVFLSAKDKWAAIVDEIKALHDVGRPVLVGTTSVEKSELVSRMLSQKYGIKHEVLNAKQHEREAEIVAGAGQLGAVMIATNMAGRGTDIKLGRFTPEELIEHWKRRDICPREVTPAMQEAEMVAAIYRHIAPRELGLRRPEVEAMSDGDIRLALLRKWAVEHCWVDPKKVQTVKESELLELLDTFGGCLLHRLRIFSSIEDMGGLHIIGTERHESRRIDNQLRGRSGRQGDNGSSRFFLSLEDDLMKMFAGPATLRVLSRLGMKEGDAIEHPMLTRAVEKAQRKVEERNFQIRKNILEYDEPMEYQRRSFYGTRQRVLENRDIKGLIFDYIRDSVRDAADTYLDPLHKARCIVEWVRENFGVGIDPSRIKRKDREDLHLLIQNDAREEAMQTIRVTVGEYVFDDTDPSEWDASGLCDWARTTWGADLTPERVREMNRREICEVIEKASEKRIASYDLSPLDTYLAPLYGERELAEWANRKFGGDFKPEMFQGIEDRAKVVERLLQHAREVYRDREISYPIEFAIEMTAAGLQQNPQAALTQFTAWVRSRYERDWDPAALPSTNPADLRRMLIETARTWDENRIRERAAKALAAGRDPESIDRWFQENALIRLTDSEKEEAARDPETFCRNRIAELLRTELTQFERWVLLQILDGAWKDHLYAMDQLRDSIGFRALSQRDPRIEFKKESSRLFEEMHDSIREKVTDLIFKGRLMPQVRPQAQPPAPAPYQAPAPQPGAEADQQPLPSQAPPVTVSAGPSPTMRPSGTPGAQPSSAPAAPRPAQPAIAAAAAMAAQGTEAQRRDIEIAERAGAVAGAAQGARRPSAQAAPAVGRNEPCPCGSGKKFKQCCGKR